MSEKLIDDRREPMLEDRPVEVQRAAPRGSAGGPRPAPRAPKETDDA